MPGRFNPNPADATSSIPIFPDGSYEFQLGAPKPFAGTNQAGKENHGVRFQVTCVEVLDGDPNFKGKTTLASIYQHTEGARNYSKAFMLAAYGYERNYDAEKLFDEEVAIAKDWSYDPEDKSAGDGWSDMEGKRIVIEMKVDIDEEQNSRQNFVSYSRVE